MVDCVGHRVGIGMGYPEAKGATEFQAPHTRASEIRKKSAAIGELPAGGLQPIACNRVPERWQESGHRHRRLSITAGKSAEAQKKSVAAGEQVNPTIQRVGERAVFGGICRQASRIRKWSVTVAGAGQLADEDIICPAVTRLGHKQRHSHQANQNAIHRGLLPRK